MVFSTAATTTNRRVSQNKKRVIWKKEISVDYVFAVGIDLNRTHDEQEMKSINGVNPYLYYRLQGEGNVFTGVCLLTIRLMATRSLLGLNTARTVCILLECFLVRFYFHQGLIQFQKCFILMWEWYLCLTVFTYRNCGLILMIKI